MDSLIPTGKNGIEVRTATKFTERLVGLLSYRSLPVGMGLIIPRCSAVHTFGMKFTIDVLFLDSQGQVLKIVTLPPWKFDFSLSASCVLELSEGGAHYHGIKVGETLW